MKKKTIKLTLQNRAKQPDTPTKSQFVSWIEAALANPILTAEITVRIVSPEESAALNEQYRHKAGPTNVLSFAYPSLGETELLLGDLVICAELVQTEAAAEHKTVLERWAHLTVHGILHLQGHDHIQSDEAEKMEQLEIHILQTLGFPNPYHGFEKE